jgi:hypothetical protein
VQATSSAGVVCGTRRPSRGGEGALHGRRSRDHDDHRLLFSLGVTAARRLFLGGGWLPVTRDEVGGDRACAPALFVVGREAVDNAGGRKLPPRANLRTTVGGRSPPRPISTKHDHRALRIGTRWKGRWGGRAWDARGSGEGGTLEPLHGVDLRREYRLGRRADALRLPFGAGRGLPSGRLGTEVRFLGAGGAQRLPPRIEAGQPRPTSSDQIQATGTNADQARVGLRPACRLLPETGLIRNGDPRGQGPDLGRGSTGSAYRLWALDSGPWRSCVLEHKRDITLCRRSDYTRALKRWPPRLIAGPLLIEDSNAMRTPGLSDPRRFHHSWAFRNISAARLKSRGSGAAAGRRRADELVLRLRRGQLAAVQHPGGRPGGSTFTCHGGERLTPGGAGHQGQRARSRGAASHAAVERPGARLLGVQ